MRTRSTIVVDDALQHLDLARVVEPVRQQPGGLTRARDVVVRVGEKRLEDDAVGEAARAGDEVALHDGVEEAVDRGDVGSGHGESPLAGAPGDARGACRSCVQASRASRGGTISRVSKERPRRRPRRLPVACPSARAAEAVTRRGGPAGRPKRRRGRPGGCTARRRSSRRACNRRSPRGRGHSWRPCNMKPIPGRLKIISTTKAPPIRVPRSMPTMVMTGMTEFLKP